MIANTTKSLIKQMKTNKSLALKIHYRYASCGCQLERKSKTIAKLVIFKQIEPLYTQIT